MTHRKSLPALAALALILSQSAFADDVHGLEASFHLNFQSRQAAVQAAAILGSETTDDLNDGFPLPPVMLAAAGAPTGGGLIPPSSLAPKTDGTRAKLGYCAWDTGPTTASAGRIPGTNSLAAPVLAVLAPGLDGLFSTTCAQIATGSQAQGDDIVITYSVAQIRSLYSLYAGAPVADLAALSALAPSSLRDGEIRLIKSDNTLQRFNATTSTWLPIASAVTESTPIDLTKIASGALAAPSLAFLANSGTGLFYTGAGLGVASGGTLVGTFSTTGLSTTALTTTGSATIGGTLNVTGATTLTGQLNANGGITASTLTTSGNTTVGGSLAVTGATTLTGALAANGGITASTLATTGNATIGGTLTATGLLTANGGITTTNITAATLTASGRVTAKQLLLASNTADPAGVEGMLAYRSDTKMLRVHDGVQWRNTSGWYADANENLVTSNTGNTGNLNEINNNILVGFSAGKNLQGPAGSYANNNIAIGSNALESSATLANNSGFNNISLGPQSLQVNSSGNNNFAAGYRALWRNTTGSNNVAIGATALQNNTTGSYNTVINPYTAGMTISTGSYNTLIGGAGVDAGTGSNAQYRTGIGSGAVVATDNTVVLGNTTAITVIGATASDTTNAGFGKLQVTGAITPGADNVYALGSAAKRWSVVYATNGTIQTSDARLKTNINTIDSNEALKAVMSLRPVRYNWINPQDTSRKMGFIAQELMQAVPEAVYLPPDPNGFLGVNYGELAPILAAAIQQQQKVLGLLIPTPAGLKLTGAFEADHIRAASATIQKIKAEEIETDRLRTASLETGKLISGESTLTPGTGCQLLFPLQPDSIFEVRAITASGAWASMRIGMTTSGPLVQRRDSSPDAALDLNLSGISVCATVTQQGQSAKASWLRVL